MTAVLREIEILRRATSKGFLAIEKATYVSWERDKLEEALQCGRFLNADDVIGVDRLTDVVGDPFPACPQQSGSTGSHYRLAAQTSHFYLFAPRPSADANQPRAVRPLAQDQRTLKCVRRIPGSFPLSQQNGTEPS